jgi:HEAT repeat protein
LRSVLNEGGTSHDASHHAIPGTKLNLVAESLAAAIDLKRNLALLVALLILALPATSQAKDTPRPLSSYNWSANASPNLATKPPPKAAVRKLMEQLESDYGEANDQTRICSFRFVDLGHDGNLTLLVSRYDGGRGGCGDVYIVDRTAGGFQQHDLSTTVYGNDNVNDVLSEIDGKTYLAVGSYQIGDRCTVGYTKIYVWDGSNYSNQSDQPRFKPYYEHEIETLKKGGADFNPECNKANIAKIQRDLLGAPPNTGLDDAIRLAKSSDPAQREFAAEVLADIGTAEAKPYLRALIGDPNQEVAETAKRVYAFGHFDQKPPQKDFLPQIVGDQLQAYNPPVVGPWRLILPPPFNGAPVDLKAGYSKWWDRLGFDSQEQCGYAAEVLSKSYGQSEPYRDGKCVPASALEKSTPLSQ